MSGSTLSVADRLSDLGACIEYLDQAGMLIRVKSPDWWVSSFGRIYDNG